MSNTSFLFSHSNMDTSAKQVMRDMITIAREKTTRKTHRHRYSNLHAQTPHSFLVGAAMETLTERGLDHANTCYSLRTLHSRELARANPHELWIGISVSISSLSAQNSQRRSPRNQHFITIILSTCEQSWGIWPPELDALH